MSTVSPLLARIQKQETLTLKSLSLHVPKVKRGHEAKAELEQGENLTTAQRQKLHAEIRDGENSKEILVLMALPLVKTIAHKEYNRRQSWSTRVSFDDMIQEGIGGFLRGIQAYDVNGKQSSATNYLGQWILSDIRRHVETLEHDFSIPHETIERHRKIRAIRSHLFNKLGRMPSDEEILDHANSGAWTSNSKMGKLVKDATPAKKLTAKNIEEERTYAGSTGQLESIVASDNDNEYYERNSSPVTGEEGPSTTEAIENSSASDALTALFEEVFRGMGLGSMQEDIIRQKFGMKPHTAEVSLADIAKKTRLTKYKINQVLTAFSTEMSSKGSVFHRVISATNPDELESMGMAWVMPLVGDWNRKLVHETPSILTMNLRPVSAKAKTYFGAPNRTIAGKNTATFRCSEGHETKEQYFRKLNVPDTLACITCGKMASRISSDF